MAQVAELNLGLAFGPAPPRGDDPFRGHRARLRERAAASPEALPDYELLELILARGQARKDVKPVAKALLARFGSLGAVLGAEMGALRATPGVGESLALDLKLVHEAAMRMSRQAVQKRPLLSSWTALLEYARATIAYAPREEFRVLYLDKRNHLIADRQMHQGTIDKAPVYPREILRTAIELGAVNLILMHNHPSGDPSPSRADIEITRLIREAVRPCEITIHDHLVVARDGVASFKAMGLL